MNTAHPTAVPHDDSKARTPAARAAFNEAYRAARDDVPSVDRQVLAEAERAALYATPLRLVRKGAFDVVA